MATIIRDEDCKCYFDPARITPMSDGDRKSCFLSCATQFLENLKVSPASNNPDGNLMVQACDKLKGGISTEQFWPLYWCDINYCGLGINRAGNILGIDPNVNNIINTCNSLGVRPIVDSGPPPEGFGCHSEKGSESNCQAPNPVSKPEVKPSTRVETDPGSTHSAAHPTASSNAVDSHGPVATDTSGSDLSAGAKIALAVCSVLGLLTLVGLVFIYLRRRKRRKAQFHSALQTHSRQGEDGFPCTGGGYSPTPLISPAGSAVESTADPPLTPPLRLRDRRLLPPILRPTTRSSSPPLTPITPAYTPNTNHHDSATFFPPSPICAPTLANLVPRNERTPTPQKIPMIGAAAAALPPIPFHLSFSIPTAPRTISRSSGSLNSSTYCPSSLTGHSSLRHEVSTIPPPCTLPGSPPRPPRPHDTPLEIPDLLSPATSPPPAISSPLGPPPSRALPPPPPLPSPPAVGVVVPPLPSAAAAAAYMQQRSVSSPSVSAVGGGGRGHGEVPVVNFMDLAGDERCRGSWGSWDGDGDGGGMGIGRSTSSRIVFGGRLGDGGGARMVSSPVMGGMGIVREHDHEGEYRTGHGDPRYYIGGAF